MPRPGWLAPEMSGATMNLAVGDVIGGTYRIERLLGEGGMARVYEVAHSRLPKKFALKLIIHQDHIPASFLQRFRREAEVLAKLRHPHIVEVIDWNVTPDGLPYLVMECLEGEDLAKFLARTGSLHPDVALSIIYQIGQALQASHDAGVIHRDLKPSNIFLDNNGPFPNFAKVLDFGIAKVANEPGELKTSTWSLMGTPAYMSPEQASGQACELDPRSDQYSLALILYELLSGKSPFRASPGEPPLAILTQIVYGEVPTLPLPRIGQAIRQAMSRQPADRYPSVKEFLAALGARRSFAQVVAPVTIGTTNGELSVSTTRLTHASPRRLPASLAGVMAIAGLMLLGTQLLPGTLRLRRGTEHRSEPEPRTASTPPMGNQRRDEQASPGPTNSPGGSPSQELTSKERTDRNPPASVHAEEAAANPAQPAIPSVAREPTSAAAKVKRHKAVPPQSLVGSKNAEKSIATASASPAAGASAMRVSVTGTDPDQANLIRDCLIQEVKSLQSLPLSYTITLQRSGVLHIMEAPEEIRQTDFGSCLRRVFFQHVAPAAATITVRGGR